MNLIRMAKNLGRCSVSIFIILSLSDCSSTTTPPEDATAIKSHPSISFASSTLCAENAFLQKYECSFNRIEQAARSGDPDAQYALGYLYYYGIGTTQDRQTGLVWIRRAAAQGQTVAQAALKALSAPTKKIVKVSNTSSVSSNSGNSSTVAFSTASSDTSSMTTQPEKPLTDYLPNYGEKRVNTTEAPPTVNLSTSPDVQ